MKKGKFAAVLFIVFFLLAVALICFWLTSKDNAEEPPLADVSGSMEPQIVVVGPDSGTSTGDGSNSGGSAATPAPTSAPAATPTATPVPTPVPTPTPAPVVTPEPNRLLNSGSFYSDTGVPMNLRIDWSVSTISSSQAEVTVKVSLDSYSLHLTEVPGAVSIDLNGSTASMASPAVDYDGSSKLNTVFGSKTFTVNISSGESINLPLSVTWHFGGKYSNVDLTDIAASGTVSASR